MKTLQTVKDLLIPKGAELIKHENFKTKFSIDDIILIKQDELCLKRKQLCLAHAQALIKDQEKIPNEWYGKLIIFAASVIIKDDELFYPAIISSDLNDITALSNRDSDWCLILLNIEKNIKDNVYNAVFK